MTTQSVERTSSLTGRRGPRGVDRERLSNASAESMSRGQPLVFGPLTFRANSCGGLIREWRLHRRLTQAELSAAMGVERSYLTKIESGARGCSLRVIEAAARALACRPQDLAPRDSANASEFIAFYQSLTEAERAAALVILRGIFGVR